MLKIYAIFTTVVMLLEFYILRLAHKQAKELSDDLLWERGY